MTQGATQFLPYVENAVPNSTGIIEGGYLTIGTPNTTFSISDGRGMVTDNTVNQGKITPVKWTGKTNITATYIGSGLVSYVAINSAATVVQQLTPFTYAQSRTLIVVGSLIHVNLTNLDAINQLSEIVINPLNQLNDLNYSLGQFSFSGNVFTANGANLNINKSAGKIYSHGANWAINNLDPNTVTLAQLTALTFQYRFQTGTNGATGIAINPDIYDVAGVSTAVPPAKFTIQRIYSFVSNNVKIQPGQTLYTTLALAKSALQTEVFVTESSINDNGIIRGFLIVKQGATDLTSATQAFFYEAGKFSGQIGVGGQSVSSLQNAYDNSLEPEVLTDATRGAISVRRGSGADTDTIYEGLNGAGTTNFSVTGNGVITGVGTNITGTASGLTAGNVTTNANLTGEATSVGNATTLTNSAVIGKVLTGYISGAGTVAATDTILQAIQKLNGNTALSGTVTSVTSANASATVANNTTTPVITIVSSPAVETANEATDTTCFPLFVTASGTQTLQAKNNTGLTYNSNTNNLGATTFTGALSGNATTATSATTATTLAVGRTISGTGDATFTTTAFDGSAAVSGAVTVSKINGTTLSGLATGILKNTTGTGVPSIAVSGTDYAPASSGSAVLKGNGAGGFSTALNSDLPTMTATVGGAVPTPPNNTTTFLRGDGTFAAPTGGAGDVVGDDVSTTVQNIVAYSTTGGKNITELTGTQGDVLYHNGTNWAKLTAGTSGHYLKTLGAGANPLWAAATATLPSAQTEVDFGSTPVSFGSFTIVDANVSATSKIVATLAYLAPTGKDLDEIEMDDLIIKCGAGVGTFDMYITEAEGSYLADKFKINYIVG